MKFITKNTLLSKTLTIAIEKYDKMYIAVAWATCHETSKIVGKFKSLLSEQIKKLQVQNF